MGQDRGARASDFVNVWQRERKKARGSAGARAAGALSLNARGTSWEANEAKHHSISITYGKRRHSRVREHIL